MQSPGGAFVPAAKIQQEAALLNPLTNHTIPRVAPLEHRTLVSLLRHRAIAQPGHIAYTFLAGGEAEETQLTYGELDQAARAIATGLLRKMEPGSRALLLFPSGLDYIEAFFGCLYAGVIAVPAYPPRSKQNQRGDSRIPAIAAAAQASAALATSGSLAAIAQALGEGLRCIATDQIADSPAAWREPDIDSATPALLQYTSGSTGTPKGVIVSHGNLLHNQKLLLRAFEQDASAVVAGWLPMFHDMGLVGNILHPLYLGARCILMPPAAFLQRPFRWLEAISKHRATTSGGPNFAYDLCVRKIGPEDKKRLDLSSWTVAFNGAEPIRPRTLDEFSEAFAQCGFRKESFYCCYGLAEATLIVSGGKRGRAPVVNRFARAPLEQGRGQLATGRESAGAKELVSCGRPLGSQRVLIVDPGTQALCAAGQVGEVCVAGPSVAHGYWNEPEATAETFARIPGAGLEVALRTGDLGFQHEGELYIAGRLKDLIILHGRNHHANDIELTAQTSHAALRPGCGAAFPIEVDGGERLAILHELETRRPGAEVQEIYAAIREAVADEHDIAVHTIALLKPNTLPKTSSGKLRRRAAREGFLSGAFEAIGVSVLDTETQGESDAAHLNREALLALDPADRQQRLEAYLLAQARRISGHAAASTGPLALDSLMAVELMTCIESQLGVEVPLGRLLGHATAADLASDLAANLQNGHRAPAAVRSKVIPSRYPLSFGQKALFFIHRLDPANTAYTITRAIELREAVDTDSLRRAIDRLVARHSALRATFHQEGREPHQAIHESMPDCFREEIVAGDTDLRFHLSREAARPFDLGQGPLLRMVLFRAGARKVLALAAHHIVCDLASLATLCRELGELYSAETSGRAASLPSVSDYSEYVQWQSEMLAGPQGAALLDYWKNELRGEIPALALYSDRPRPAIQTYHGAAVSFEIDAAVRGKLEALCRQCGATLHAGIMAAFQSLLHRYTGQTDILTGTPASGRVRQEFLGTVGYFVNPLPVRVDFSGRPAFADVLRQVSKKLISALEHSGCPFPLLVDRLGLPRDPSRSPVFQAMVATQTLPSAPKGFEALALDRGGAAVEIAGLPGESIAAGQRSAQFDIALEAAPMDDGAVCGRIVYNIVYNTDLFDEAAIERLSRHFETLLRAAVEDPEAAVADLPLLSPEERVFVLEHWNQTRLDYPPGLHLHRLIEERAWWNPAATAVEFGARSFTYSELNSRANAVARRLREAGAGPGEVVGIAMERSLEMAIGLLAILKAGAAYLPLDRDYPAQRLAFMAADARIRILLVRAGETAFQPDGVPVLSISADAPLGSEDTLDLPLLNSPDDIAYVIYTSGSTGAPKGVMTSHSAICNRLLWMQDAYSLSGADKVLQKTTLGFDVSVWEVFWPWVTGACLVLAGPGDHKDPVKLVELIRRHSVTVAHFVPSMLRTFLDAEGLRGLETLRLVVSSGEALDADLQRRFFERMDARLENLYGPTEAAVDVTRWTCSEKASSSVVPIGYPIWNTRMHILDAGGAPVPIGVPGELHIAGAGLARGYLNRPELTAQRFVPNPFSGQPGARMYRTGDLARYRENGAIEYLGRLDHQVKIRGNRVELEEIESALAQHPEVRAAAVAVREGRLIAYTVPRGERAPLAGELREFLSASLPSYMLPARCVTLDRIPLTASGKLDRRALPEPAAGADEPREYRAPETAEQAALAGIWERVLGRQGVGITDNFFSLGGDSILSIEVAAEAGKQGLSMQLEQLFRHQTIEELAAHIQRVEVPASAAPAPFTLLSGQDRERLPQGLENAFPMSVLQQGLVFHGERGPDYEVYVTSVHVRSRLEERLLEDALGYVIARHAMLRTTFDLTSFSEPLQLVHSGAPVSVEFLDLRGLDAEDQERAIGIWIAEEKKRKFDWSRCPFIRITVHQRSEESMQVSLGDPLLDGWSVASLLSELLSVYGRLMQGQGLPTAPPLEASFDHFVALERETMSSGQCRDFWDRELEDCNPSRLPRWSGAVMSAEGQIRRVQFTVGQSTAKGLRDLANQLGAPIKSVLLGAQLKTLSVVTGQKDLVTGLIANGRPVEKDSAKVLGTHLNALPFRMRLNACTWRELVQRTFDQERALLPFRRYPVAELQRRRGRQPLFESVFNFTHFHAYRKIQEETGIEVLDGYASEQTYYPLTTQCNVDHATQEIRLALDYTADFSAAQAEAIARYHMCVLQAMAADPEARHDLFSPLPEEERRQLLGEWNDTALASEAAGGVTERIAAHAKQRPESLAVRCAGKSVTYGELNARANQLARFLSGLGAGPETPVAICMDRSAEMIAGLLGILKCGAAYVPLDPAHPDERLAYMVENARAICVLTEERHAPRLAATGARLVLLDRDWERIAWEDSGEFNATPAPENLAYSIFTSGSTGRPKLVALSHGGLLNLIDWHQAAYRLVPEDRMTQIAGAGFDAAVWEIWPTLASGASLHLPGEETRLSPEDLRDWLVENRISISFVPTPVAESMLQLEWPARVELRTLLTGGDKLRRYPQAPLPFRVVNHYGPTENTVVATAGAVDPTGENGAPPPIGRPIANTQAYIVDADLQLAPVGTPGELLVAGESLARGYAGQPAMTAEKFIPNPFGAPGTRLYRTGDLARHQPGGDIHFLGRLDQQVKVRGFRIELGEIEALLSSHPEVREAAAAAWPSETGEMSLAAYVVPRSDQAPAIQQLREFLRTKLPEYMLPVNWTVLDRLPLNTSGKIDRRALPQPGRRVGEERIAVAARDEIEQRVVEVWEQVLQRAPIGATDNFFELGGHSLLATQVISRLRKIFEMELALSFVLESPTVEGLAARIREQIAAEAEDAAISELLDQLEQFSDEQVLARLDSGPSPAMRRTGTA